MVELVGIVPPPWIENMELADSTMFLIGEKGSNSYSAVQNGTKNGSIVGKRSLAS